MPQVAYGYYAGQRRGQRPGAVDRRDPLLGVTRFAFPRQKKEPFLCIADFFRSVESGEPDYAAFQVVTMGREVSPRRPALMPRTAYVDYLKLHGLGVEMAEALAEYWHHRIREEWGFVDEDGPTFTGSSASSTGAGATRGAIRPAPTSRTTPRWSTCSGATASGSTVSDGFQMHPEQTTDAIICHHPQAKYFGGLVQVGRSAARRVPAARRLGGSAARRLGGSAARRLSSLVHCPNISAWRRGSHW